MNIQICKSCKNSEFDEEWKNGPLVCVNCGAVDYTEIVDKNKLSQSKDVNFKNKNVRKQRNA
jgi:transcription initiation factor TFIIIB Brf1 subunit/transcription initiation factor TFIIB